MPQIRLNKTSEIQKVLSFLQARYRLLSEAEIIKMLLSERYYQERQETEKVKRLIKELKKAGRKLGDKFLAKKGLRRSQVSEKEFYRLLEDFDGADNS